MTVATRAVVTRAEVEDFLYHEAALLDDWKLNDWLVLNCYGKGAWGINFTELDSQLIRGDGLRGRMGKRSDTSFAHMYDVGCLKTVSCPWSRVARKTRLGSTAK